MCEFYRGDEEMEPAGHLMLPKPPVLQALEDGGELGESLLKPGEEKSDAE